MYKKNKEYRYEAEVPGNSMIKMTSSSRLVM